MSAKQYYESQAEVRETGAEIDGRIRKAARLFQKHLGRAERLLDVGCGVGTVGLYLQRVLAAKEVYGVEISESRVAAARRKGLEAVQADVSQGPLPFEDGSFDAIFCGEVIEHLVDPDHLLDELNRTLAPSGVCVLTTPNLAVWYNRLALMLGWQPFATGVSFRHEVGRPKSLVTDYGCRDHLRVFTYKALKELIRLHEFTVIDATGVRLSQLFRPDWSSRSWRALIYEAIYPVDLLLSVVPSLSTGLVIAFKKGTRK
jgi:methionine biosynthesis protein MetW